ncbi:MAG: hypothetical protein RL007_741 [Bacteroidota bacterium]|jgi:hypothetical protein
MKILLQIFLVFTLINFSGGQQVLQTFFDSASSDIQNALTASLVEEEIHETDDSSFPDEDEVEKEWMPVTRISGRVVMVSESRIAGSKLIIPDSEAEDHSPPPELLF